MNEYGVEESWTKLFKFSYMDDQLPWNPRLIPICFFLSGDILMFIESAIVRYKPKDNKFEVLLHADNLSEAHVNVYVESLVSPHPNWILQATISESNKSTGRAEDTLGPWLALIFIWLGY